MFKSINNTSGKFITLGIFIFLKIKLNDWYYKIKDIVEGALAKGQINSESAIDIWTKLLNDDMIIEIINTICYIVIFWTILKIIATISANKMVLTQLNKHDKLFNHYKGD